MEVQVKVSSATWPMHDIFTCYEKLFSSISRIQLKTTSG